MWRDDDPVCSHQSPQVNPSIKTDVTEQSRAYQSEFRLCMSVSAWSPTHALTRVKHLMRDRRSRSLRRFSSICRRSDCQSKEVSLESAVDYRLLERQSRNHSALSLAWEWTWNQAYIYVFICTHMDPSSADHANATDQIANGIHSSQRYRVPAREYSSIFNTTVDEGSDPEDEDDQSWLNRYCTRGLLFCFDDQNIFNELSDGSQISGSPCIHKQSLFEICKSVWNGDV